jgi:hypothetical protein
MRMYTVIFEQDGEPIATITTHAANEEDARVYSQVRLDAFFRENPEDPPQRGGGFTIRVERTELYMEQFKGRPTEP